MAEVVRDTCGDLVEQVSLIDTFSRHERTSRCYRFVYRSMDRSLTNYEVDILNNDLREVLVERLKVELR